MQKSHNAVHFVFLDTAMMRLLWNSVLVDIGIMLVFGDIRYTYIF